MSKRNPQDVWKQLVAEAGEDEVDGAANVSVAQADAELREAGFDVQAERARANALLDDLSGEGAVRGPSRDPATDEPASEPNAWVTRAPSPHQHAPPRWGLLLAATLAAATAGGILYAVGHRPKPNDKPVDVPQSAPTAPTPPPPPTWTPEPPGGPAKPRPR
jgi:hypothetical protein